MHGNLRKFLKPVAAPVRPYTYVLRYLEKKAAGYVTAGPFKGMRYIGEAYCGGYHPRLLGTYEKELWHIVEQIVATHYSIIIDIGAAEGYYAVGLASRKPDCLVSAWESSAEARRLLARMAEINGCQRNILINETCDAVNLSSALQTPGRALVIVDIEGAEEQLVKLDVVPLLARADILVEVHDGIVPGVGAIIRNRFVATHEIESIPRRQREPKDFPMPIAHVLGRILRPWLLRSMCEWRDGATSWLMMRART